MYPLNIAHSFILTIFILVKLCWVQMNMLQVDDNIEQYIQTPVEQIRLIKLSEQKGNDSL